VPKGQKRQKVRRSVLDQAEPGGAKRACKEQAKSQSEDADVKVILHRWNRRSGSTRLQDHPEQERLHSGDDCDSSNGESLDSDTDSSSARGARPRRGRDPPSASDDDDLESEEEVDSEAESGSDVADLVDEGDLVHPAPQDSYIGDWSGAPVQGAKGFNEFATTVMRAAGVASSPLHAGLDTSLSCPLLLPHQEAVAFLLHPKAPISRLLVDHPTGSGKTREMIQVLDNFFYDSRPKIPVFPTSSVCRNFYRELLRWPSRYRDYFGCMQPADAAVACQSPDWRGRRNNVWDLSDLVEDEIGRLCTSVRDILEMKGAFFKGRMRRSVARNFYENFPGEQMPTAPLRALRYTSAGGSYAQLGSDSLPVSALFKIGFDGSNVYSNKIVLLDEVHNLVRKETQYGKQLSRLRDLLVTAGKVVLAGFTGTPILNDIIEGQQLLEIMKGRCAAPRPFAPPRGDEGFLSSFPMRPAPLFPTVLPPGMPDRVLTPKLRRQLVKKITLTGESLKMYEIKKQAGLSAQRLRAYCNMSVHFASIHDGKSGAKARILQRMEECAPKFHAIGVAVQTSPAKTLILVARKSGYGALLAHLHRVGQRSNPRFTVASIDQLAEFNAPSNLRGERFRMLVADAAQCSEGVSFFAVRRVLLADVPNSPGQLVQQCGRAIRMFGHHGLPEEEQTVTMTAYVAGLPRWMRSPLGAWCYRAQKRCGGRNMELCAKKLLRALQRAGITDLKLLKQKLDVLSAPNTLIRRRVRGMPLASQDVATFLEHIGLRREAKLLRESSHSTPDDARIGCMDHGRSTSPSKEAKQRGRPGGPRAPHHLCRALQALYLESDMTEIAASLTSETADEEGLRQLAQRSRDFAPALLALRTKAVDSTILGCFMDDSGVPALPSSDGESSA
jgi:hypothetical protein